jgi:hypothetical protein
VLVSPGHAMVSGASLGFISIGIISVNPRSASTERTFSLGLWAAIGSVGIDFSLLVRVWGSGAEERV